MNEPLAKRVPSDISAKLPSIEALDEVAAVVAVLLNTADDDTVRNEAATLLHRANYAPLPEKLMAVLENPLEKARFRAFAMQHLGAFLSSHGPYAERVAEFIEDGLQDRHVEVRRESLLALVNANDPLGQSSAVEALQSKARGHDEIRDLAISCIGDLNLREHAPALRQLARDENDVVAIAAIATLGQWRDEESRGVFEAAIKSENLRIRKAAYFALRTLDREKLK